MFFQYRITKTFRFKEIFILHCFHNCRYLKFPFRRRVPSIYNEVSVFRYHPSRTPTSCCPGPEKIYNVHDSGGFRGGSGGSLEPPSGTKLFQFHGEIMKNQVQS